jgi:hypothetical protein
MMKQLLIISLVLLSVSVACSSLDDDYDNMDEATKAEASEYVDALMNAFRNGELHWLSCPDVQWAHIPQLLEYGKSTAIIGDDPSDGRARVLIPANPISSYLMFQCSEGMFALWMVEAARIHTLNPLATGIGGWPSQNPFVQTVEEGREPTWYINDPKVQQEVLNAYTDWWKEGKGKRSTASVNPLEGTGYMWH